MTPPKTCTDCTCLQRDKNGLPIEETEAGVPVLVCQTKKWAIEKTTAETQAVCCEEES